MLIVKLRNNELCNKRPHYNLLAVRYTSAIAPQSL
jgi:hypothetical protein